LKRVENEAARGRRAAFTGVLSLTQLRIIGWLGEQFSRIAYKLGGRLKTPRAVVNISYYLPIKFPL